MSYLQIYRASAGSGKTFVLTSQYLLLCFESTTKFKNILAVTFTNKAAEEMKSRILEALVDIDKLGTKADFFSTVAERYTTMNEVDIRKRAHDIHRTILHNYSYFSVSTIDSFMQSIIRSFCVEMGIYTPYEMQMDEKKVINELIAILFKKAETDKELLEWITEFVLYRMDNGESWDFRDDLKRLASEIFKEKFAVFAEMKLTKEERRKKISDFKLKLFGIRQNFEDEINQLGKKGLEFFRKFITDECFSDTTKHIKKYFEIKIPEGEYQPNTTSLKGLNDREKWVRAADKNSKKPEVQSAINRIYDLYEEVNPIFNTILQLLESDYKDYISANAVLKNYFSFAILNDIAAELPEYRKKNNVLLMSDVNKMLKEIINDNDTPFIYDRIGNRYEHILIDEFQDTSGFQWENFKPLIENSLAQGSFNMIVGDVKQSIYRWRNGDWRLLQTKVFEDLGHTSIQSSTLETNWRSRKNIVDFNNRIYLDIPRILREQAVAKVTKELGEETVNDIDFSVFENAYVDSFQKIPNKPSKIGGVVKVRLVNCNEVRSVSKKLNEVLELELPLLINTLITDKKYKPSDITILIRRNKESAQIVNILKSAEKSETTPQYDIVTGDAYFISNSPAVNLIVKALKYYFTPKDQVNLVALAVEWHYIQQNYKEVYPNYTVDINNPEISEKLFSYTNLTQNLIQFFPLDFIEQKQQQSKYPVFEQIEFLINTFRLGEIKDEIIYLLTLQNYTAEMVAVGNISVRDFLEWWESGGSEKAVSLPPNENAIQIMTIHKSKGLAFKVLIMPYCSWDLNHNAQTAPIIWCDTTGSPLEEFACLPLHYRKELLVSYFSKDYVEEMTQSYFDALNMLYVATTRPEDEMYIFAPFKQTKEGTLSTIGDVLHHAIENSNTEIENFIKLADFVNEETEEMDISVNHTVQFKEKTVNNEENSIRKKLVMDRYYSFDWRKKVKVSNHSEEFKIISDPELENRTHYGSLMHKALSGIVTEKDIDMSLKSMKIDGLIDESELIVFRKKIKEYLTIPEAKEWFSGNWKVFNERAILLTDTRIKIPDRVLISNEKSIVIDYKFSEENEEYHTQVGNYMKLLREMGYKNVEGYLFFPDKKLIIKVIEK